MIKNYMKNTHANTHCYYAVDIVQAFRASRNGETERFQKFSDTSNMMLLWHGSRLANWVCIFHGSRLTNWVGVFHRVYELLLQKHLRQATCLGKGFILLICSLEVQIIAMLPLLLRMVCFCCARLLLVT